MQKYSASKISIEKFRSTPNIVGLVTPIQRLRSCHTLYCNHDSVCDDQCNEIIIQTIHPVTFLDLKRRLQSPDTSMHTH